jgi:hypothetical protein
MYNASCSTVLLVEVCPIVVGGAGRKNEKRDRGHVTPSGINNIVTNVTKLYDR